MLDIKFIRKNKEEVAEAIKNKNIKLDLERLLELDGERVRLLQEIEELNSLKNNLNDLIKEFKSKVERKEIIEKGKNIKAKLETKELEYKKIKKEYENLADKIPNIISKDTPIGKDETENKVIKKTASRQNPTLNPKIIWNWEKRWILLTPK